MEDKTTEFTRKLFDEGKIIEAGWIGLMIACKLQNASDTQKAEMRKAFYAGAQHVFASLVNHFEEGTEPTENDLNRMTMLHDELSAWAEGLQKASGGH